MQSDTIIRIIAGMILSYLIGSISFAVIISKMRGNDIRKVGSKNAGSTNMLRAHGAKAALLTFIGDFAKGTLCVGLVRWIFLDNSWQTLACGLAGVAAILGHMKPIYFQFKGGKGVATVLGVLMMFNTKAFLIIAIPFVTLAAVSGYVSLAATLGAFCYPFVVFFISSMGRNLEQGELLVSITMASIIIFNHRENIKRLLNGTERNIWKKNN